MWIPSFINKLQQGKSDSSPSHKSVESASNIIKQEEKEESEISPIPCETDFSKAKASFEMFMQTYGKRKFQ